MNSKKTISQVFEEFLSDQEARLSPTTLSKYESIISLLESYLESYWPGHDQDEYSRSHQAGRHLLRYVRPRRDSPGLQRVSRLLHAPQSHVRQGHNEGCWNGDKEAGHVAGGERVCRGRFRGPGAVQEAARDLPDSQEVIEPTCCQHSHLAQQFPS